MLEGRVAPDTVEAAALVTSELVTNAVVHAQTDARLDIRADGGTVTIRVEDAEVRPPVVRHPSPWDASGRGLLIVEQTARHWGVQPVSENGKSVWAALGE